MNKEQTAKLFETLLTEQQVYDQFGFLEGLVSESVYKRIADVAFDIQNKQAGATTFSLLTGLPVLEPVAARFDFDGYGWSYIDNGSGSDWKTRKPDCEFLYTGPQNAHLELARAKVKIAALELQISTLDVEGWTLVEDGGDVWAEKHGHRRWVGFSEKAE